MGLFEEIKNWTSASATEQTLPTCGRSTWFENKESAVFYRTGGCNCSFWSFLRVLLLFKFTWIYIQIDRQYTLKYKIFRQMDKIESRWNVRILNRNDDGQGLVEWDTVRRKEVVGLHRWTREEGEHVLANRVVERLRIDVELKRGHFLGLLRFRNGSRRCHFFAMIVETTGHRFHRKVGLLGQLRHVHRLLTDLAFDVISLQERRDGDRDPVLVLRFDALRIQD